MSGGHALTEYGVEQVKKISYLEKRIDSLRTDYLELRDHIITLLKPKAREMIIAYMKQIGKSQIRGLQLNILTDDMLLRSAIWMTWEEMLNSGEILSELQPRGKAKRRYYWLKE